MLLKRPNHFGVSRVFVFSCMQSTLAGSNFRIEGSAFVRKLSKLKPRHFMLELVSYFLVFVLHAGGWGGGRGGIVVPPYGHDCSVCFVSFVFVRVYVFLCGKPGCSFLVGSRAVCVAVRSCVSVLEAFGVA